MTDATHSLITDLVGNSFRKVQNELLEILPNAKMTMGYSHNPSFPFRAYATFSLPGAAIDVCFDVQETSDGFRISGDICRPNGTIIKDLCEDKLGSGVDLECGIIDSAKSFSQNLPNNTNLIATELASA